MLSILYRGPLASCNYGCAYCPFAKRRDTREQLADDRNAWRRFVAWAMAQARPLGVLVTPWGEALIRRWYQDGLAELSHRLAKVAAQTNLSGDLAWVRRANPATLALWCTYHPRWTSEDDFVAQCGRLADAGINYSVGVVGQRDHADAAVSLRKRLPTDTYVWINAVKALGYTADEKAFWTAIDPLFDLNTHRYPSAGKACGAGERAISVDGDGTMRRCHFIGEPIGNLYDDDWAAALQPRACSNTDCHCHIGYVHLDELRLDQVFGDGLLERIPRRLPLYSPTGT